MFIKIYSIFSIYQAVISFPSLSLADPHRIIIKSINPIIAGIPVQQNSNIKTPEVVFPI